MRLALLRAGEGVGKDTTVLQRDAYSGGPDRIDQVRSYSNEHPSSPSLLSSPPNTPALSTEETKELAFPTNSLGPKGSPKAL